MHEIMISWLLQMMIRYSSSFMEKNHECLWMAKNEPNFVIII